MDEKYISWAKHFCGMFNIQQTPLMIPTLSEWIRCTIFEAEDSASIHIITHRVGKYSLSACGIAEECRCILGSINRTHEKICLLATILTEHPQINAQLLEKFAEIVVEHFVRTHDKCRYNDSEMKGIGIEFQPKYPETEIERKPLFKERER